MSIDPEIRDEVYALFQIEASELLQNIERELLSLREDCSATKIHTLMRHTHTLKGTSGSLGMETVQSIAHSLEDVFKRLYSPTLVVDAELETLLFEGYESLRLPLIAELAGSAIHSATALDHATAVFSRLQAKLGSAPQDIPLSACNELGLDLTELLLEAEIQQLNRPTIAASQAEPVPSSGSKQPCSELEPQPDAAPSDSSTSAALLPALPEPPGKPIAAIVTPTVRVELERLERLNHLAGALLTHQNRQVLGSEKIEGTTEMLAARSRRHQRTLSKIRDLADRLLLLPEQHRSIAARSPLLQTQTRFDPLEIDPYGEFHVLLQSALEEAMQIEAAADELDAWVLQSSQNLEKQQRLLTSVRDDLMSARMQPLRDIFQRFPRLLPQLTSGHSKAVALQLSGTEVLVDKAIAEKLYDPLLHLLRNAIAHGIESAATRLAQGKPATGQLRLHAYQRGKYTVIEVSDDGQGIDYDRIRQQAVSAGLLSPEQASTASEPQLLELLFEPGFSTAPQLSQLSGRGVGLDAVRSQINLLQGSIRVRSQPGQGTTFSLLLPLTLTVARLLVCQAGGMVYAFLPDAIDQILLPPPEQMKCWRGQNVLQRWHSDRGVALEGTHQGLIPIRYLSDCLEYASLLWRRPETPPSHENSPLLLLQKDTETLGLAIDQVVGEQELVIMPIGSNMAPDYIYGCSSLGDGRLTLVIDGALLLSHVLRQSGQLPTVATSVQLTLSPATQPLLAAAPTQAAGSSKAAWEPKVLVVDDSITLRQNLTLTLQKGNYQVLQARDGVEALEYLQQQPAIGIVVCDIEMPRMNGFEFLGHRAQDPKLAQIPVVMVTSRSGEKHRQVALELGAAAYLTKPYSSQELLAVVTNLLHDSPPCETSAD